MVPFDPAGTSKASDGYSGNPAQSERCYPAESLWHLRIAAVSVRLYDRYFSFQRSHHDRAAKFCTGPCYAVYLSAKPSTSHSYRSVCAGIGSCWCLPVGYRRKSHSNGALCSGIVLEPHFRVSCGTLYSSAPSVLVRWNRGVVTGLGMLIGGIVINLAAQS